MRGQPALWVWSQLREAVRALEAVTDCPPPDEDEDAWRLLYELDALRERVELRLDQTVGGALRRSRR